MNWDPRPSKVIFFSDEEMVASDLEFPACSCELQG
jgi:hypothetical protein